MNSYSGGLESSWVHSARRPLNVPLYLNRMIMMMENWENEDWQSKPKYSEETRPSATLSTTNPTRPDPSRTRAALGGEPETNRLSYGTALNNESSYAY
jgi:hypothetical protein